MSSIYAVPRPRSIPVSALSMPNPAFDMVSNMVYYQTMIKLNINQAKTHLSAYLARLRQGETIVLCKRNTPIAEIRPLRQPRTRKRPIGLAAGEFTVPASFFDPLPEDLVAAFAGGSESS